MMIVNVLQAFNILHSQLNLMTPLLIIAAILPGLLLCLLIYFLDKYEREDILHLLITFCLGMLCAVPAIGIQFLASKTGIDNSTSTLLFLVNVFIVVAFSEELVKMLALLGYPYRQDFFNEPLDGIVYTMMIGLGFATVENLIYANKFGMETTLIRSFTAVPAHAIFAVIMGYFVGLAKFYEKERRKFIIRGFLMAFVVHGIYDFFLLQEYYDWLMGFGLLTIILGIILSWQLIRMHKERSPFNEKNIQP